MSSSRDQRGLKTKFRGLVLGLVVVSCFRSRSRFRSHHNCTHSHASCVVISKFDYAKYLLLLAMVTYNSGLKCQSDSTNRKLNSGC